MSSNPNPRSAAPAPSPSGNGCRTSTVLLVLGAMFILFVCVVGLGVGFWLYSTGAVDAQALLPAPTATVVMVEPAEVESEESGPVLSPPLVSEVESTPTPAAPAEEAAPAEVATDEVAEVEAGSEDEVDEASPMAEAAASAEATTEAAEGDFSDESFVQIDEETYNINVGGHIYALGIARVCETEGETVELNADDPQVLHQLITLCEENGGAVYVRVWRMANEQYTVWSALFDIACDQPVQGHLQWDNAFSMQIVGGETGITCQIYYLRDLNASAQALENGENDPYDVANEGSELGLGWFVKGPSTVTCGDATYEAGLGRDYSVIQLPFDRDESDVYAITISVEPGNVALFLQGGVFTPINTCTPETFNRFDPPAFALLDENGDPVSSIHGIR